ncbi:hypothetical protein [Arthrobacter sp. GMC3]|uniref:hypothetical protein n=1 Tax=Arthrobacter sp. GMC3 TaxID=2058894 RepID=UPI000CE440E4|nr:hypothetical protein [Arthrobacter sp. GMC3]
MDVADLLSQVINKDTAGGIEALDPTERMVFLISEAEILADMSGVDEFLERYARRSLGTTCADFGVVGREEIAKLLGELEIAGFDVDCTLERLGSLISSRDGYTYDDVVREIERRLSSEVSQKRA